MVALVPSPAELDAPLPRGAVVVVPFDDSVSLGAAAADLVARFDAALVLDPGALVAALDRDHETAVPETAVHETAVHEPAAPERAVDAGPASSPVDLAELDAAVVACRSFGIPAAAAAASARELRAVADRAAEARRVAQARAEAAGPEPRIDLRRAREADRALAGLDVGRARVRDARRELYQGLQRANIRAGAVLLLVAALTLLHVPVPGFAVGLLIAVASATPVVVVIRGLHRLAGAARVVRASRSEVARALPAAGFRTPAALRARLAEHVTWHQRRTDAAAAAADADDALATWRLFAGDVPVEALSDVLAWAETWRFALEQREVALAGVAHEALDAPAPSRSSSEDAATEAAAEPPVQVVIDAFATLGPAAQGDLLERLAQRVSGGPVIVLTTDPRTRSWAAAGGIDRPAAVAALHRRRRTALRKAG